MFKTLTLVLKSLGLITNGLLCLRDQFLMHVHHLFCQSIWRMVLSNNVTVERNSV